MNDLLAPIDHGMVYMGYKPKPSLSRETQLNLTAANALFTQIGIAPIVP